MQDILEEYVTRFSKLHTDRARWKESRLTRERAPHKSFLLLSVIDQFRQGLISTNLIEITPDLIEAFQSYWSRIMPPEMLGTIVLPFFHLRSEGFWDLVPQPGKEQILEATRSVRSIFELNNLVTGAQLAEDLFQLLCTAEYRDILQTILINTYFADEVRLPLLEQARTNGDIFRYSQELLNRMKRDEAEDKNESVRSQGFRRAVITAYAHRCAMSGIRIQTPQGRSVVNASHIVPWSVSHNDDPSNGLALSPVCHWAFDEGLVSISQDYRIILSRYLRSADNIAGDLLALDQREIILPNDRSYWPSMEAIEYHRKKVFVP